MTDKFKINRNGGVELTNEGIKERIDTMTNEDNMPKDVSGMVIDKVDLIELCLEMAITKFEDDRNYNMFCSALSAVREMKERPIS